MIDATHDLETQLCAAVHDPDADVERIAHLIAGSDRAQVYLVELVGTIAAIAPASPAIERAEALLEHGLAIAAVVGEAAAPGGGEIARQGERG